jgi:hypothetical protein
MDLYSTNTSTRVGVVVSKLSAQACTRSSKPYSPAGYSVLSRLLGRYSETSHAQIFEFM